MDETLYAGHNLYECAVVCDENYLTLYLVTNLKVGVKGVPRMSGELLETEGDPLLLLVEVKYNDFDLFVEGNDLFRVVDAAS